MLTLTVARVNVLSKKYVNSELDARNWNLVYLEVTHAWKK